MGKPTSSYILIQQSIRCPPLVSASAITISTICQKQFLRNVCVCGPHFSAYSRNKGTDSLGAEFHGPCPISKLPQKTTTLPTYKCLLEYNSSLLTDLDFCSCFPPHARTLKNLLSNPLSPPPRRRLLGSQSRPVPNFRGTGPLCNTPL